MNEAGTFMLIEPITHRFWYPDPLARPWLWRKRVVSYRYFINDLECDVTGAPLIKTLAATNGDQQ